MINKMILQGRFTDTPELKQTPSGVAVCSFTIAWSERIKNSESKCFLRCIAWRGMAEHISKYFVKGQEAVVSGKLVNRTFADQNGSNKTVTELVIESIDFCGKKEQAQKPLEETVSELASKMGASFDVPQNNNTDFFQINQDDVPF